MAANLGGPAPLHTTFADGSSPRVTIVVALADDDDDDNATVIPTAGNSPMLKYAIRHLEIQPLSSGGAKDKPKKKVVLTNDEDGAVFVCQNADGTAATLYRVPLALLATDNDDNDDDDDGPITRADLDAMIAKDVQRRHNGQPTKFHVVKQTVTGVLPLKAMLALASLWAYRARSCGYGDDHYFNTRPEWRGKNQGRRRVRPAADPAGAAYDAPRS